MKTQVFPKNKIIRIEYDSKEEKMNKKEKIGVLWLMHFGGALPWEAKCSQCEKFKAKICEGGKVPADCILKKDPQLEFFPASKRGLKEIGDLVLECAKRGIK